MKIKQLPTFVLASPNASAILRAQTHVYNERSSESFFDVVGLAVISSIFGLVTKAVASETHEKTAFVVFWALLTLSAVLFLLAGHSLYLMMRIGRAVKSNKAVRFRMTFLHFWRAKLAAYDLDYREKESLDWLSINRFDRFQDVCKRWESLHTLNTDDAFHDNLTADQALMASLALLVAEFAETL